MTNNSPELVELGDQQLQAKLGSTGMVWFYRPDGDSYLFALSYSGGKWRLPSDVRRAVDMSLVDEAMRWADKRFPDGPYE